MPRQSRARGSVSASRARAGEACRGIAARAATRDGAAARDGPPTRGCGDPRVSPRIARHSAGLTTGRARVGRARGLGFGRATHQRVEAEVARERAVEVRGGGRAREPARVASARGKARKWRCACAGATNGSAGVTPEFEFSSSRVLECERASGLAKARASPGDRRRDRRVRAASRAQEAPRPFPRAAVGAPRRARLAPARGRGPPLAARGRAGTT